MKMRRRRWITTSFVFGMVLLVAALLQLGTSEAAPAAKVIELSYNHFQPAEGWFNKVVSVLQVLIIARVVSP
jgi:hypothetical protein